MTPRYFSAFFLIKPTPPELHGKIITFIMLHGFKIVKMKNGKLPKQLAMDMYENVSSDRMMPTIVDYVTSGEVIGLEVVAPDAVSKLRQCVGAKDPHQAAPGTLRSLHGENIVRNIAHCCETRQEAEQILNDFFGYQNGVPRIPFRATYQNCTCCIIKPHVIVDSNVGAVLEHISTSGKFFISCMGMFAVPLACAKEFFEIYEGVLPEHKDMCFHLAEGKCIALEVKSVDPSVEVVSEFRKLCGPRDPDLCRQLYPSSIRARFGKSVLHNAVHCTDLPEDGAQEVEYFFKLLASQPATC